MVKRSLITGLIVWVPIVATILTVRILFNFFDSLLVFIPLKFRPEQILGVHIPGLSLVIVTIILLLTGMLTTNYLGQRVLSAWESLLERIPLVRSVYQGVKQSLEMIFSKKNGQSFRQAVLVEHPRKGLWSIGFVTNTCQQPNQDTPETLTIFLPTTPNPTTGFLVLVDPKEVIALDLSVDQALKFVITLGTAMPHSMQTWSTILKSAQETAS